MMPEIGFDLKRIDNRRNKVYQRAIDFYMSADPGDDIHSSYEEVGTIHGRIEEAIGCLETIRDPRAISREKAPWCGNPRVKMLYGHGQHRYTVRLVYDYEKPSFIMTDEEAEQIVVKVKPVLRMVRAQFIADWRAADHKAKVAREADHIAAQTMQYIRREVKEKIQFDKRYKELVEELRTMCMARAELDVADMSENGVTYESGGTASEEVVTQAIMKLREKAASEEIARGGRRIL